MNTVVVDFEYTNSKGELVKTKRTLIEVFEIIQNIILQKV